MNTNEFRYQLYIKRAVLQAHTTAMDDTILDIERDDEDERFSEDDYRRNEEAMFAKYWKIVSEIE